MGIPYLGRNKGPRLHDLRHPYVKYKTKNILKFSIFSERSLLRGSEECARQIFQLYPVVGENVNPLYQQVYKRFSKCVGSVQLVGNFLLP